PIFDHARDAARNDEFARVQARIPADRGFPIIQNQVLAAGAIQPAEGPLIMAAKVVGADHWQMLIAFRSWAGSASRAEKHCRQDPFPRVTRAEMPAVLPIASLTK